MARLWLAWGLSIAISGCAPRLVVGTACTASSECDGALVCRLGRCRSECVSQRDCPPGLMCLLDPSGDGSCALPEESRCTASSVCAEGLMCIDGACANACTTVAECPADSRCEEGMDRRARCVSVDRPRDDAGVGPDVGADDAGLDAADAARSDAPDAAVCAGPGCDPVESISLTQRGTCALTETGAVYCWGLRSTTAIPPGVGPPEVLCEGDLPCITTPARAQFEPRAGDVEELAEVSFLTGSQSLTCAVSAGRLVCWGAAYTRVGGPGLGEIARRVRTAIDFVPADVEEVSLGAVARFAHRGSAPDYVWGEAVYGEFGAGAVSAPADVAIPSISLPAHTRLGGWHGCGIEEGQVLCWGANGLGQSGQPPVFSGDPPLAIVGAPTAVPGLPPGAIDVAPGRAHTCALFASGDVWCWGNAVMLPNPGSVADCTAVAGGFGCPTPRRVFDGGANFVGLASAYFAEAACAIDDAGAVFCWGTDPTIPSASTAAGDPRRIEGLPPVRQVVLSTYHACAVVSSGEVYCWGENDLGQLGDGSWTTAFEPTPRPVRW
jgi:alpha-tubulin suppressor-like RCC1 family protein